MEGFHESLSEALRKMALEHADLLEHEGLCEKDRKMIENLISECPSDFDY